MRKLAASPVCKLGGHVSLTARRLRQERLAAMQGNEPTATPSSTIPIQRASHVFDPWLRYDSPLIAGIAANVDLSFYSLAGERKRAVKQRDRHNVARIIEAILANLAFAIRMEYEPPSVAVNLGASKRKLSRYDAQGFASLPRVIEVLSARNTSLFTVIKSSQRGISSCLLPLDALTRTYPHLKNDASFGNIIRHFKIEKFRQELGGETIILTRTEKDYVQNSRLRERIDYCEDDTKPSVQFRAEMETINTYLAAADMHMEPDGGPPVPTGCRRLLRFFSLLDGDADDPPRFDQGGRLFGGWWQGLPKERRGAIRLANEPIADLDFSSMFLRLAYIDAGHEPPTGDLYANIPGFSNERWRDGVKTITNALLFRTTPMTRLPRDADLQHTLPPGTKGTQVRDAILAAHPLLSRTFETMAGFRLMFTESQILVRAMLNLIAEDVPGLPMHDGIMVPASRRAIAQRCMAEAAEAVTGYKLPIMLKSLQDKTPA